jgi:hypothetical protein
VSGFLGRAGVKTDNWAVHEKDLEPDDVSLLLQVADIVPVRALPDGLKRLALKA